MQCFCIPFKPYCSKMAKRDTYSNTTKAFGNAANLESYPIMHVDEFAEPTEILLIAVRVW